MGRKNLISEPLFKRNRPLVRKPIPTIGGPKKWKKRKPSPHSLAWFWWHCLNEAGAPIPKGWSMEMGLRPAKKLLEEYPYELVLDAVGWASSKRGPAEGKASYTLWWLLKWMPTYMKKVRRWKR